MAFCVKCGTSLPQGAMFCPKCGTDLRKFMQQSAAPQVQTPAPKAEEPAKQPPVAPAPVAPAPVVPTPVAPAPEAPACQEPVYETPIYQNPVWQPPVVSAPPAPTVVPGAGMVKAGKILSTVGFVLSAFILLASYIFMVLTMSMESILDYKNLVLNIAAVAAQSLALSSFGLVFSYRGEKKSQLKTAAGKRFGWLGLSFSAFSLANMILVLIAFAFSGRILSI